MECFYCKGQLELKNVDYSASRKGYHLIIDDIPAWVCHQCGEPLFDEGTVETIQEMLEEVDAKLEKLNSLTAVA